MGRAGVATDMVQPRLPPPDRSSCSTGQAWDADGAGAPTSSVSLYQLIQQCSCFLEIGRVEAFGKPAIDRREQIAGVAALALVAPEAGEAGCSAHLEKARGLRSS